MQTIINMIKLEKRDWIKKGVVGLKYFSEVSPHI